MGRLRVVGAISSIDVQGSLSNVVLTLLLLEQQTGSYLAYGSEARADLAGLAQMCYMRLDDPELVGSGRARNASSRRTQYVHGASHYHEVCCLH